MCELWDQGVRRANRPSANSGFAQPSHDLRAVHLGAETLRVSSGGADAGELFLKGSDAVLFRRGVFVCSSQRRVGRGAVCYCALCSGSGAIKQRGLVIGLVHPGAHVQKVSGRHRSCWAEDGRLQELTGYQLMHTQARTDEVSREVCCRMLLPAGAASCRAPGRA